MADVCKPGHVIELHEGMSQALRNVCDVAPLSKELGEAMSISTKNAVVTAMMPVPVQELVSTHATENVHGSG